MHDIPVLSSFPFSFTKKVEWLSLSKIADSGQCFRWQAGDGGFFVPVAGHIAFLSQDDTELNVLHDGPSDDFWHKYLDLERDYASIARKLKSLPHMEPVISSGEGLRVLNQPFFETCISYIISQNNNIPRIKKIIEGICGTSLSPFPDSAELLGKLERKEIDGLGYRDSYLLSFCYDYMEGKYEALESASPLAGGMGAGNEASALLLSARGIGEKVSSCIELYSLGMVDALPRDVWIKRAENELGLTWHPQLAGIQQLFVFFAIRQKAENLS